MASGDATFARCNVDWINDPRCENLPNNDARWLSHVLWLLAVQHHSPVIPSRYDAEWLRKKLGVTKKKFQVALRSMVDSPEPDDALIKITPDGRLVVEGVQKQNSKLQNWKVTPQDRGNPWVTDTGYVWGDTGGYGLSALSERERERNIERESNIERLRTSFRDVFWPTYPRKVKKNEAEEAWIERDPDDGLIQEIMASLRLQLSSIEWAENNGQYIPHPTTYINKSRWTDVLTQPKARNTPVKDNLEMPI